MNSDYTYIQTLLSKFQGIVQVYTAPIANISNEQWSLVHSSQIKIYYDAMKLNLI